MTFPVDNSSFDLFLSNYVLDLLAEHEIQEVIQQAHRLLRNDGILAITSITRGMTLVSRIRMSVWSLLHKIRPRLVGAVDPYLWKPSCPQINGTSNLGNRYPIWNCFNSDHCPQTMKKGEVWL